MSTPILSALPVEQAAKLTELRNALAEREPVIAAHNGIRSDLQDPELVDLLKEFGMPSEDKPFLSGGSERVASQAYANRR